MDWIALAFAISLLIFGALNTIATKATFQVKAVNLNGDLESFQKPWFGVYRMFQGMAFVILIHFAQELHIYLLRKRGNGNNYLAIDDSDMKSPEASLPKLTPLKSYLLVIVPATCDLLGTTCTYVGLFYNTPSIWQMFRGAMVLFATFFSVTVLKRTLSKVGWLGLTVVIFALVLVGIANMLSEDETKEVDEKLKVFGMGMILIGMMFMAVQVVVEELLMKGIDAPPMMVVGMEGVWGCIICWAIVFPLVTHLPGSDVGGVQENLRNDIAMVNNSKSLQFMVAVYLFSVFTFNISGMMVTYRLTAVHRTLLEASRTAVIWGVDLAIKDVYPDSDFGESWNQYSCVQLLGFVLLVLGQATYAELITWGIKLPSKFQKVPTPSPSPFGEPGMLFRQTSGPDAPFPHGRFPMHSPKGQLDLGVDLPDDTEIDNTGLDPLDQEKA